MKLVILHSSDTHGFLMPTDYQNKDNYDAPISLSRVSSVVKSEKEKYGADNVLVTDSGDCLQGSPLASYTQKLPEDEGLRKFTEAYNEVGYDARALGTMTLIMVWIIYRTMLITIVLHLSMIMF